MKTKFLALLTGSLLTALSLPGVNIAYVSYHAADDTPTAAAASAGFTNAADVGYTKLLAANGHNVTRFVRVGEVATSNPDLITALNTNDLVIISRCVPSGDFDSAAETAAWSSSVTVPLISMGGYINRANRLGFHTGDTIPDANSTFLRLQVRASAHPIFAGIALDASGLMINPYSQRVTFTNATTGVTTLQNGISVVTSPVIGGGAILATVGTLGDGAFGGMVIAEFPAGTTTQRGDVLAAKRLVFLSGSRESGITAEGSGIYDLQPDGATMLLNAVTYMTTPQSPAPKCYSPLVGATNLVPGDAWTFNAGVLGDAPLSYQWYKNGQALPGATDAGLTFTSLLASDAGDYHLIVTNNSGSATSTVGRLEFAVFPPASITNSLISYWPLDSVLGTKTVDVVSGYDLTLVNLTAADIVPGQFGNAFQFNGTNSILERVHSAGDALPIYQHPNFTVSFWVQGAPQSDRRVFAEGSTVNGNTMFDLGTHNTGADGTVDIFIRNDAGTASPNHAHSAGTAFDGWLWHNVVYVQRDVGAGNMRAQLWIDGQLDSVVFTPIRPVTANTTALGALRRAGVSAWFAGLIDETAVWNRALSPEEIAILQVTRITNAPSRLLPLAVTSFKADVPAVVNGGSTTLRWEVSKDASQVTIDPLGDVTAQTSVGVGSAVIAPNQTTSYVLTVKRGTDTLSATTSVAVVEGVAPGWTVLDNFDQAQVGNLFDSGYWNDTSGTGGKVVSVNGNKALRTTSAGISFLNLRGLSVLENQARTLFFRVIAGSDTAAGITNIVGLTDKSQRSYGDEYSNIGPVLYVAPFTNDLVLAETNAWYLGARNGDPFPGSNDSNPIDYPAPALESGVVYNIWMDITNAPMGDPHYASDQFTVYVQKEGGAPRTVLFQDYLSDRDLYFVDVVLGGMLPALDKLVVMGNSGTLSATFDDFYLSTSGYNATVPKAYTVALPPGPLSIGWSGSQLEIRWTNGTLQQAEFITGPWSDVSGNPTSPYLVTPSGAKFYRARQ